jgi:hypothetical protein
VDDRSAVVHCSPGLRCVDISDAAYDVTDQQRDTGLLKITAVGVTASNLKVSWQRHATTFFQPVTHSI